MNGGQGYSPIYNPSEIRCLAYLEKLNTKPTSLFEEVPSRFNVIIGADNEGSYRAIAVKMRRSLDNGNDMILRPGPVFA